MRILGVDISLRCTGYGVIEPAGGGWRAVAHGLVRNPAAWRHTRCLAHLADEIGRQLAEHQPAACAIEGAFYSRNVRTVLALGEARGVVLAACQRAGVPVFEHAPRRIKQALTGSGGAQKPQVARMVMAILGLREEPPEDAADALAAAICHAQQGRARPGAEEL